jgi:opacity protein-like surface antigen
VRSPAIPMALAVWFAAGAVSAQPVDQGAAPELAAEGGERKMTMPAGRALVQAFAEISLSQDAALEPLSIAPDVWYGVSDVLTVGLVHSARGATGFFGDAGNGLCLTGDEGGCGKIYNSVGIDARYHFYREGDITAAAEGGLFARSIDPFQLALKVGATGRWQRGLLALEAAPSLFGGLTEREVENEMGVLVSTNKEALLLPVTAIYTLTPQLGLAAQAGFTVPFEDLGDLWTFGMSVGAQYMVNQQIFADLAFSLPLLLGGPDGTGADERTLTLGVGYAM